MDGHVLKWEIMMIIQAFMSISQYFITQNIILFKLLDVDLADFLLYFKKWDQ